MKKAGQYNKGQNQKKLLSISEVDHTEMQKSNVGSLFEEEARITMLALTKKNPDGCPRHTFLEKFQDSLKQSIQDVSEKFLMPLEKSMQLEMHQEQKVGLEEILNENKQTETMKGEIDLVDKITKYGEFLSNIPHNLVEYNHEQRNPYEFWFHEDLLGSGLTVPQQNVNLICEAKSNFREKENKAKYCHNVVQLIRDFGIIQEIRRSKSSGAKD